MKCIIFWWHYQEYILAKKPEHFEYSPGGPGACTMRRQKPFPREFLAVSNYTHTLRIRTWKILRNRLIFMHAPSSSKIWWWWHEPIYSWEQTEKNLFFNKFFKDVLEMDWQIQGLLCPIIESSWKFLPLYNAQQFAT